MKQENISKKSKFKIKFISSLYLLIPLCILSLIMIFMFFLNIKYIIIQRTVFFLALLIAFSMGVYYNIVSIYATVFPDKFPSKGKTLSIEELERLTRRTLRVLKIIHVVFRFKRIGLIISDFEFILKKIDEE